MTQRITSMKGIGSMAKAMRIGWRIVHPDFQSSHDFRWPYPGGVAVAPGPIIRSNTEACPAGVGDGLCIAKMWRGAAAGGISSPITLIVAFDPGDVLGEDADKLRVTKAYVLDVWDAWRVIRQGGMGADLQRANLRRASLYGANLRGANLYGANLQGADLRGAELQGADLRGVLLQGANLQGADLLVANLQGAYLWRANLQGAYLYGADLRGADLQDADLQGANLHGADLRGADLRGALLQGAHLQDADCTHHKHERGTSDA